MNSFLAFVQHEKYVTVTINPTVGGQRMADQIDLLQSGKMKTRINPQARLEPEPSPDFLALCEGLRRILNGCTSVENPQVPNARLEPQFSFKILPTLGTPLAFKANSR